MAIFPPAFEIIIVVLFGLIMGSFATALSWRVARSLLWAGGRSECPACHAKLGVPDLIPLLSWLALRGRCRHCKAAIGIRYPLTELAVLGGCLGAYAAWHFTLSAFIIMAALPFLAALFLVDLEQMILPDRLLIILAGQGVAFIVASAGLNTDRLPQMLALRAGAGVLYGALAWATGKLVALRRKRAALGFGDVKFYAVAGLWLGAAWLPGFMIAGGVAGVVWGIGWRLAKGPGIFPFGPALIMGFYACLLLAGAGFEAGFSL